MAEYNPFFADEDEEPVEDSIVAAVESPSLGPTDDGDTDTPIVDTGSPKSKTAPVTALSGHSAEPSYDAIAAKFLKDRMVLTALEMHTELIESGRELLRLRDYFSNPGNFERQENTLQLNPLHRTSSETTFDSLDLARYSDDGVNQSDDKHAVLEFELRKAKDTIKALRANLTEAAESEVPSPIHTTKTAEGVIAEDTMKPLERRALNFLINEFLLQRDYKLTSITFCDENEEQDFDDWDDVGLNRSRPPDLLHLYRDYSRHVIPAKETAEVGCGDDSILAEQSEEVEADLGMAMDEEREKLEAQVLQLSEELAAYAEENQSLKEQMQKMQKDVDALQTLKTSTPGVSPIGTPHKASDAYMKRTGTASDSTEREAPNTRPEDAGNGEDLPDLASNLPEEDADSRGHMTTRPEDNDGQERPTKRNSSPRELTPFQQAINEAVLPVRDVTQARLREEVSRIADDGAGVVQMLARCLPHIVPNVLIAKREELVPLIVCTVTLHPDPNERDKLLNLLFNLIKKPDEEQRQVILSGCVAFAKYVGPERAEAELLPQCWEQITHKFPERRQLVAESCGALAPYLPNEIRSSLVLSMLQQLLQDKTDCVREVAVRSLGLVFSLTEDTDKYNQGLELVLSTLEDPSESVLGATRQVFLPAFASWAYRLGRLESNLITAVLKRLELAAIDLQRASRESSVDERKLQLFSSTLQCLIPALFASVLLGAPFDTEEEPSGEYEEVLQLEVTRFPKPLCPLHDIAVIVGDKQQLNALVQQFERYLCQSDSVEDWTGYTWVLNEFIPRLLEVLGRLEAVHRDSVKSMAKLFLHICRTFGKTFTDSKIKPKFQAVLNVPEDQLDSETLLQMPITRSTLPVFASGVLGSYNREEDRKQLSQFLQESLVTLAVSGAPLDSIRVTFLELHTHPTYHELLLAALWSCVVHKKPAVRSATAKLFGALVKGINESLVSGRVVPALITLSGDEDINVKIATIPAFGTILESTTQKETLDRVYSQFQTFLDDPLYKEEYSLLAEVILTFGKVGPNAEPKFRDEFVLPRLAAIAYTNNNTANETRRSVLAMALFNAYSALSCCFISNDLIWESMLPGLRCLRTDLDIVSPEHEAVVASMIKEFEAKLGGKERSSSVTSNSAMTSGSFHSPLPHMSEDTKRTLLNKIGAQRTKVANVFHARKK
ncbi:RAB11-binding protein RELCH-like [Patiria miniata]|uniref:LisH domain-containing protein n=1 Tax=Patiria miniata TaxID=46514 RepID=A0A913ZHH6_PATMI|nr:RAB11-binding protein RELCH-like [Patiria miniata]